MEEAAEVRNETDAPQRMLAAYGRRCLAQTTQECIKRLVKEYDEADKKTAAPMAYLRETFGLSDFAVHVLRISFSLLFDTTFQNAFRAMNTESTVLDVLYTLYGGVNAAGFEIVNENRFLTTCLLEDSGSCLDINPVLSLPVMYFLMGLDYICDATVSDYCLYEYSVNEAHNLLYKANIYNAVRSAAGVAEVSRLLVYVCGAEGAGRRTAIKAFCEEEQSAVVFISATIFSKEPQAARLLLPVFTDCVIRGIRPAVTGFHLLNEQERADAIRILRGLTVYVPLLFVTGEEENAPCVEGFDTISIHIPKPQGLQRVFIWQTLFARESIIAEAAEYANKFDFTIGQMQRAIHAAKLNAALEQRTAPTTGDITNACIRQIRHSLMKKAKRVDTVFGWNDIVLPPPQKEMLLAAAAQLLHKHIVYDTWGFDAKIPYGRGLSMLFSGPPGTGKTMAAQVLAKEIGLELYKVNLSVVVSKYIGETEKNLNEIFDEAVKSRGVLFFDEADALFSKRTEVKTSNDKNANMEVSFLLQKMEEYDGIAILCTNLLQNVDEAFKRRIKFIIDFPFPDRQMRLLLWQTILPGKAPVSPEVDFDFLSGFELSGSAIKNVIVNAAFAAAAEKTELTMRLFLLAVRNEFFKSGKLLNKEDFSQYHVLLDA